MAKPEWGTKRACQSCGARFYDMQRQPIVCPKCGEAFELETAPKPRRSAAAKPAPVKKPAKPAAAVVPAEAEADDAEIEVDDDADLLEADEDLDDDAEDVLGSSGEEEEEEI
ncbi:MAG: TIGR02300 family protein [Acetobacterales bacterium]